MIDPFAVVERHLPRIGAWSVAIATLVAMAALAFSPREAPVSGVSTTPPHSRPAPSGHDGCLTMPDGLYVCDDGEND